ncbi:MAG: hypothetical protein RL469_1156, partial [Pseudomonadota bacterium]
MTDPEPQRGLPTPLGALVLAAGAASRYGSPKALAPWRGKPMLQHTLDALAPLAPVTLVLGANADRIRESIRVTGAIVTHDDWSEGLASSIRAGLDALERVRPPHAAILIALGDQPTITRDDYTALISTWHDHPDKIVAARHGEVRGAPCIFPRKFFGLLQTLRGDRGARALIERERAQVIDVEIAAARFDVDTPADLRALENTSGH